MRERLPSYQFCEISLRVITLLAYLVFETGKALMNVRKKTWSDTIFKHFTKTLSNFSNLSDDFCDYAIKLA